MKTIFLLVFLLMRTASLQAQQPDNMSLQHNQEGRAAEQGYSITGSIEGMQTEKIYLSFRGKHDDSAIVQNGHFSFTGKVENPKYVSLEADDQSFTCAFWLENAPINIQGNSEGELAVNGSVTEDEYRLFMKEIVEVLRPRYNNLKAAASDARNQGRQAQADSLEREMNEVVREQNIQGVAFVKQHPGSYVSLNFIHNRAHFEKLQYEELSELFHLLDERVRNSIPGKNVADRLQKLHLTAIGSRFPALSQPDTAGVADGPQNYRGKFLLLTFGAGWNKDYLKENESKLLWYQKYHSKGLEMLDVLFDGNREDLVKVVKDNQLPWKVVSDLKRWNNPVVDQLCIESIPQNYLLDTSGTIIARGIFGKEAESKLQQLPFAAKEFGNPVLPFTFHTPDGRMLSSTALKGKVILLDFWATWCAPCRMLTKELDSLLSDKYGNALQMIGVDYLESAAKTGLDPVQYWKEHGYRFPMVQHCDDYGKAVNAGNPVVMLIDQNGIVRGRWVGRKPGTSQEIAAMVNALIKPARNH